MHDAPSLLWPLEAAPKAIVRDLEHARPAPHVLRAIAWAIDFVVVMGFVLALHLHFSPPVPLALLVAYHGVCLCLTRQTLGKALMGLKVRRLGKRPGLFWSLGRSLFGYFGVDLLGLGLLLALFDSRHRALHDRLWRSEVVVVEDGPISLKSLSERAIRFADHHAAALRRRKDALAGLGMMVAWLVGMAKILDRALDLLWRIGSGAGYRFGATSILDHLSVKTQVLIAAGTTAVSTAVVAKVPPVGHAVKWALTPRYYLGRPDSSDTLAGTWRTHQFTLVFKKHSSDKPTQPAATWRIAAAGNGYRLAIGNMQVRLSRVTAYQYLGEAESDNGNCVTATGHLVEKNGYRDRNFYQVVIAPNKTSFEIETYGRATKKAIAKNCWQTYTSIYEATGTRIR
jgi:RDD family